MGNDIGQMRVKNKGERSQFSHFQCSFPFFTKHNGIETPLSNSLADNAIKTHESARNNTYRIPKLLENGGDRILD
jgi:hypothetical protein